MVSKDNSFIFLSSGLSVNVRTFDIYQARILLFTQLAILVAITKVPLSVYINSVLHVDDWTTNTTEALYGMSMQNLVVFAIEFTSSYLFGAIIQVASIHVVFESYAQRPSTLTESLTVAWDRFAFTFGFGLLYSVCAAVVGYGYNYEICFLSSLIAANAKAAPLPLIGAAVLSLAVYAIPFLTLLLPVVVLEKRSPRDAIKRAYDLVQGYRWYIYKSTYFPIFMTVFTSPILHAFISGKTFSPYPMAPVLTGLLGIVFVPMQTM